MDRRRSLAIAGAAAVPLTALVTMVSAPAFIEPGSPQQLVVGIPASRGARWVDLIVSAGPDLLELRGATRGERGSGENATSGFDARIDPAGNRIAIRVEAGGELSGDDAPSVVIVRFEGVAPGSATVTVSGIAAGDAAAAATPAMPRRPRRRSPRRRRRW